MQGLTSHILDTLSGKPAVGVAVSLFSQGQCVRQTLTDAQGRCCLADSLSVGSYELRFAIGDYFARQNINLPQPAFLDEVCVRFSVADATRHYHIPLVASPWSYTTYKGGAPAH